MPDACVATSADDAGKRVVKDANGFKNPKHIAAMFVTNTNPSGYWEDQGYNWFSGL